MNHLTLRCKNTKMSIKSDTMWSWKKWINSKQNCLNIIVSQTPAFIFQLMTHHMGTWEVFQKMF